MMDNFNIIQFEQEIINILGKYNRLIGTPDNPSFTDSLLRDEIVGLIKDVFYRNL
jgi:hypothetical protein